MFWRKETDYLWDSKWQKKIGRDVLPALNRYPKFHQADIDFVNNSEISPLVRYLFVYASYNEGEATVKSLNSKAKQKVKAELEQYTRSGVFSGRQWMSCMLLDHIATTPRFIKVPKS